MSENIDKYDMVIVADDVKRKFYNESERPILPVDVLTAGITENLNNYPGQEFLDLIRLASEFYGAGEDKIIPLNGSDEGIDMCVRKLCKPGEKIVVVNPTFNMYEVCATNFYVDTVKYDLLQENDFYFDTDIFVEFCKQQKPSTVFLANPFAQIGSSLRQDELVRIIESLQDTQIVIDEAYIEFSKQKSMIELLDKYQNLHVLRTLSKFFGLAGIRLGFLFSNKKDEFLKVRLPDNVNRMTARIGINLFNNLTEEIIKKRFEENLTEKQKLTEFLQKMPQVKKIYQSEANFLLVELNCESNEFADFILKTYNTKIKAFGGKMSKFIRYSV